MDFKSSINSMGEKKNISCAACDLEHLVEVKQRSMQFH